MRLTAHLSLSLVSLLLLPAPLLAQGDDGPAGEPEHIEETAIEGSGAADLFFRAFWIEQSGGKNAEAEMLYRKLIKAHPDSPEAPRGYLALIRLSAAKGIAADDLLRALEKGYPKSKKEIELARRLAARLLTDFDPALDETDTPVVRKIKTIQLGLTRGGIKTEDRDFLADIGSVGYPMLAYTLRSHSSAAVKMTTDVLAGQKSEEANAVLSAALLDPTVLYRMTIVDTIYRKRAFAKSLMKTLHALWPTASRSMRVRIAKVWCGGTWKALPSRPDCYGYLVLALKDQNEDVRHAAINVGDSTRRKLRPKAFVEALIPLCKTNELSMTPVWQWLPWQLGHAELAPALTQVLIDYPNALTYRGERTSSREIARRVDEATALAFARMAIGRFGKRLRETRHSNSPTFKFASLAAASSASAASLLMTDGLGSGNLLARASAEGLGRRGLGHASVDAYLSDAPALRERAVRQWYADDSARSEAAGSALRGLGLGADDFGAVLAAATAHPAKGLLNAAYSQAFLAEIGPAKAAQLAPYAKRLTDFYRSSGSWSAAGQPALEIDDSVFWKAVLPLMDPANPKDIRSILVLTRGSTQHAAVVAQWILGERGAKWAWRTPGNQSRRDHGSAILRRPEVLKALESEPLRKRFFELAGDDRYEIGRWALQAAIYLRYPDSIIALEKGVASPFGKLRKEAVRGYGKRGAVGAAALVRLLENVKTLPDVRDEALDALTECATIKQLPFVNRRLDARPGDPEASTLWSIALELDAPGATDRALTEALGAGPEQFRYEALGVLGEVSDARRIPVFRRVLRESREQQMVHRVLRTVADQYLIELGPEVLLHLRSPHNGIRQTATKAIERLKFYAEAKKLFDDQK